MTRPLILASQSSARRAMLENAGLTIECYPAQIDEQAIKKSLLADNTPSRNIATALAQQKARAVAQQHPESVVLGADQILVHKGKIFDKPTDMAEARSQLRTLRGQSHILFSAVVIYDHKMPVWRFVGRVELTMRNFSNAFLNSYLEQNGDDLFTTVGGYKLESLGSQLFLSVKGDYFSVLGLPLLEVLEFLRGKGICQI